MSDRIVYRYSGGEPPPGLPRRDLMQADLDAMPDLMRAQVTACGCYVPAAVRDAAKRQQRVGPRETKDTPYE